MDDNGNHSLSRDEFAKGLRDYGITMSMDEVQAVLSFFDKNGDGTVDFDEFLRYVRPPLNETRQRLIDQAFAKLDKDGSGEITVEDVARMYDPRHHPKYVSGEWDGTLQCRACACACLCTCSCVSMTDDARECLPVVSREGVSAISQVVRLARGPGWPGDARGVHQLLCRRIGLDRPGRLL